MNNTKLSNLIKVIFAIIVLLWGYTAFSLRHTEKIIPQSDIYSKIELNSALNTAARHFLPILTECKVDKLYYDEETNLRLGGDKNTITVLCDFEVMWDTPVWDKGETRRGWSWHMEKICGIWIVTNYGFG